jgi:cytidylate kinase
MSSIEAIIDRQIRRRELERQVQSEDRADASTTIEFRPLITVSRQRGSRGSYIAAKLAERFGYSLLHRDLIDRICRSSGYQRRIVESLDEHSRSRLESWFEGVIAGAYVDHGDYQRHLLEVIRSISALGGVVVVGRGANFIVGMERAFHVRVVAPHERRVSNLVEYQSIGPDAAEDEVRRKDEERSEFIKKHFGESIDDPLHYDLMLNSSMVEVETATNLIAIAAMEKLEKIRSQTRKI